MWNVALAALLIVPPLALMERRRAEKSEVDRAIRKGLVFLKAAPAQGNSNSSDAALGVRVWPPPGTPAWLWNPALRLGRAYGAIQTLKETAWKVILAGVV
jgi:hypothetical protein